MTLNRVFSACFSVPARIRVVVLRRLFRKRFP